MTKQEKIEITSEDVLEILDKFHDGDFQVSSHDEMRLDKIIKEFNKFRK